MDFLKCKLPSEMIVRGSVLPAVAFTINTAPIKISLKKIPNNFLTALSLFWLKAAVRRGYIKFLLLKNISHLRERRINLSTLLR